MQKQHIEEGLVRLKEIGCSVKVISAILGISESQVTAMSQDLRFVVQIQPKSMKKAEKYLRQNALIHYYHHWLDQAGWSKVPIEIRAIRLELDEAKVVERLCTFVQILFTVRRSQLCDSRERQRTMLFQKMLFNPERVDLADDLLQYKLPQSIRGKDMLDSEVFAAAQAVFTDYIIPHLAKEKDVDHSLPLMKRVDRWCGQRLHQLTIQMVDLPPEEELYKFLQKILGEKLMCLVAMRMGFFGESPRTLAKIADTMGIERYEVRQLESKAMRIISKRLPLAFPNVGKHVSDEQVEPRREIDHAPVIENLRKVGLSERASNILVGRAGISSVADILCLSDEEIDSIKNIGRVTALEIKNYRQAQLELATQ